MRYQRAELHNHTTESDGEMSPEELMCYAAKRKFEVVALTDHNTCSGHAAAEHAIREEGLPLSLLRGVEVTTFYGHILALGLTEMVDFTGLNPQAPEGFLEKLRKAGAAAIGLAHPCCLGRPVMAGCRLDMRIRNWDLLDYIEVFNTSAGADSRADEISGNQAALELWEDRVLEGCHLAAVSGKDIHGPQPEECCMITYALLPEKKEEQELSGQVLGAILDRKTFVTRGPLVYAEADREKITVYFDHSSEYFDWNKKWMKSSPVLETRFRTGEIVTCRADFAMGKTEIPFPEKMQEPCPAVLRLYEGECRFDRLLAAGIYAEISDTKGPETMIPHDVCAAGGGMPGNEEKNGGKRK